MAGYPYTNQVTDDNAKKAIIAAFDRIAVLTAAQDALQTAFTSLSAVTVVTNPMTGAVTPLPPSGGTGLGSFNTGDLIVADTPATLIGLPDVPTGNVLLAGGSGVRPFYGKVGLTTHVSGTLAIGNGGTNSTTALSGSTIMISNGSAIVQGPAGSTTTVLHGNAGGAPTYGAVSLTADVSGDLPYANLVPATAISLLLGRGSAAGAGDWQEITLGANLTMTGTVLSATGGSGSPGGADTQVQFNDGGAFGGAPSLVYNKTTALVGIGVAPSGAQLHIVNAASAANNFALLVNQQDIDQSIVEFQQSGTRVGRLTVSTATDALFQLYNGGVLKINFDTNGASSFVGATTLHIGDTTTPAKFTVTDSGFTTSSFLIESIADDANTYPLVMRNAAISQNWGFYIEAAGNLNLRNITGSRDVVDFYTASTVFNEGGADHDLRMEGDTEANLFFLDASTDRIGIKTSSPLYDLQLGAGGTGATSVGVGIDGGSGVNGGPLIALRRNSVSKGFIGTNSAVIGSSSDNITIASSAASVEIYTGSSLVAIAHSSTNFGVGIAVPIVKLSVVGANALPATSGTSQTGSGRFSSISVTVDVGAYNTGSLGWIQATDIVNLATNYGLLLNPNGGNVGIGTTTAPPSLLTVNGLINTKNYTVATLPAGTRGDIAYVTDALAPAFLAIVVGGGAVVAPVFYNGANWVGF